MTVQRGTVTGIAIKPDHRRPMVEVAQANVTVEGIEGSAWATSIRRVTLLFAEQWDEIQRELGVDLPWHTRRANVLISGLHPGNLVKQRVRIGSLELQIQGETRPCERMDEACPGLKEVLKPDLRGGVYGSVVQPGQIRVGDTVTVLE